MELLKLPQLTFKGSIRQIGEAHGRELRAQIRDFVPMRFDATMDYLRTMGHGDVAPLVDVGRRCLELYASWHPAGYAEHCAIAAGAGVDAAELFTAANMTDMRDVLALGEIPTGHDSLPADAEGCTAVLIPPRFSKSGHAIAAQTWDLNPQDLDYVVAIHRVPDDAPATWSVTCTGCLSLVGMNDRGLAVGTTNIKTHGSKIGVGYMGVLHKMLACETFAQAAAVCESAPRAAAHTYWLASPERLVEWETTAWSAVRRDAIDAPVGRTNHCLWPQHTARQGEPPSASSRARLQRVSDELLEAAPHDVASLQALFADRRDGVDSINRFAEDGEGTSTNSVVVAIPAERSLWTCRGSADRGEWIELRL
jgi:isopenicillin-N N-acyltransferase-like protein